MMGKLLVFELKKTIKQWKFIWLLFIVLLAGSGLFILNQKEEASRPDRAEERIIPYLMEISNTRDTLQELSRAGKTDESQELQKEDISNIGSSLSQWKVAINNGRWEKIPLIEMEFWQGIGEYESHGGLFSGLQGMEREMAIEKNRWMVERGLAYDDEKYPLSPGLVMSLLADWLFSWWGLALAVLLFGTVVSGEREQNTWSLLRTQPIPKWKLYEAKYFTAAINSGILIGLVFLIGIGIPLMFADYRLNLDYPHLITYSDHYSIINVLDLFLRKAALFFCGSLFVFSLVFLLSNWLKGSFSVLLATALAFTGMFGLAGLSGTIQKPWNPFFSIQALTKAQELTGNEVVAGLISSLIGAGLFLFLAIRLSEKNVELLGVKTVSRPFPDRGTGKRRAAIRKLLAFEQRKMWRRGHFLQVAAVLLLLVGFHFVHSSIESKTLKETYLHKLDNVESELDLIRTVIDKNENQGPDIDILKEEREKTLSLLEEEERLAKNAYREFQGGNWLPLYQYQQFVNRKFNDEFEGVVGHNLASSTGQMVLDASIEEKNWLMKYKLQPVFTGEFILTPFSSWKEKSKKVKQQWINDNKKVDSSGLFGLYTLFVNHYVFLMIILLFFLFGGGLAMERGKNPTIRLLRTQPVSLASIYQAKWLSSLSISLLTSLSTFTFVLLLGTLFDRFGDWMYPVLFYDNTSVADADGYTGFQSQGMGFHFIPMGEYVLDAIFLFCLGLIFLLTLSHVLGLFLNRFGALSMTLIVSLGGYFISTEIYKRSAQYSPFTFLHPAKIANGELAVTVNNAGVTVWMGTIVLFAATLALWLIGNLLVLRAK